MEKLKSILKNTKEKLKSIWENIMDSNTLVRWLIVLSGIFGLMVIAGFDIEEFKVTLLLIWYGLISTALANLLTYVYGKINYHKPNDQMSILGQIIIFAATMLFSGLVIFGTYIAQYE